jgi:hypothetical protein
MALALCKADSIPFRFEPSCMALTVRLAILSLLNNIVYSPSAKRLLTLFLSQWGLAGALELRLALFFMEHFLAAVLEPFE